MPWFVFRLISSALYAASTHVDDYLVDRFTHKFSITTLVVFSSVVGIIPAVIFLIMARGNVGFLSGASYFWMLVCGVGNFGSLYWYLKSLQFGEATLSVVFFRLPPILNLVGAWLVLGEKLSGWQIGGIFLIVAATMLFSFNFSEKKAEFQTKQVLYMLASVAAVVIASLAYKLVVVEVTYVVTNFWYFTILFACSLPLVFFSKKIRGELYDSIFTTYPGRRKFLGAEALNEALYLTGDVAANYADMLAPIALSTAMGSVQVVFVFVFGWVMHLVNPRVLGGDYRKKALIQKVICTVLIVLGSFMLV